jgi:hypothetical protein
MMSPMDVRLGHRETWPMHVGYLTLFLVAAPVYVFFATVITRALQKAWVPAFDDDWRLRSLLRYALLSLLPVPARPSLALSLVYTLSATS